MRRAHRDPATHRDGAYCFHIGTYSNALGKNGSIRRDVGSIRASTSSIEGEGPDLDGRELEAEEEVQYRASRLVETGYLFV